MVTRRSVLAALALGAGPLLGRATAQTPPANRGRRDIVLKPSGGVPAHVAGQVRHAYGFQQSPDGHYLVFDRRAHTVWRIAPDFSDARAIVTIGQEQGKLYVPTAFAVGPNGFFVVADAPGGRERVQLFDDKGVRLSGFSLTGTAAPRVTLDTFVLGGASSLQFTGSTVLLNQPETGALATEYTLAGSPVRSVGTLRDTGHESDRDLHLAFNVGLPLPAAGGELFFVFVTGRPVFRRYDARGQMLFERVMQGREIDEIERAQPTRWPRRDIAGHELPVVPPVVRTAAVSPEGELWIALASGAIYVFDADGEKLRSLRLHAVGPVLPNSLAFASRTRLLVTPGLYEFRVG